MNEDPRELGARVHALIDEYRDQCLWFLRPDYYPRDEHDTLRVLGYIERHGDVHAYQRVAELRRWLSQRSSVESAGS